VTSRNGQGDVVVAGYARTPFGKFGGALRDVPLPELGAVAVRAALERSLVAPDEVDELAFGVNFPGSERSVARQVLLQSEIPEERSAYTVDRACCSSLAAFSLACRSLALGEAEIAVAGGVDNLSRVPYFLEPMRWGKRLGHTTVVDQLVISCPHTGVPRAVQAGREALEFGIGREEQDTWALRSQERAARAVAEGAFDDQLAPVRTVTPDGAAVELLTDEVPRPDTTLEALARLSTVYDSPTVTAGNAPDLSSGSSALVLTTASRAQQRSLPVLARVAGWAMASGDAQKVASMPAVSARRALARAGRTLDEVDLIEINEAFAAVPLVTTLVLADGDPVAAETLRERTNVNGGAIAFGHPTGATGGRLLMSLVSELGRRGGGVGLVTICGGVGEAEAIVLEVS
jgi:acetyl-CoA C-acetyltransferase